MMPGIDDYADAGKIDVLGTQLIEDKMSSMAADIYQTVISREYIPNVIKRNILLSNLNFESSLGEEEAPTLEIDISAYEIGATGE